MQVKARKTPGRAHPDPCIEWSGGGKLREREALTVNIPNTLTVLRLLLTPCFALLLGQGRRREALAVLVLAALSDGLDGFLARRLRQTTELGKILDPVADKLMQLTMMLCALQRVPRMWWLLALHLVREGCLGALGAAALRRGCPVPGARWYGKTCTAVLYAVLTAVLIWPELPADLLQGGLLLCCALVLLCLVLYARDFLTLLARKDGNAPRIL